MIKRICINCKKEFFVYPSRLINEKRGQFCSRKCSSSGIFNNRYNGGLELVDKTCQQCGKKFSLTKRISKLRPAKFCSRRCANNALKVGKSDRIIHGYKQIYSPNHPNKNNDGYVTESRLVMEKYIGRYLRKDEIVHHKNHDRLDNRINNLLLLDSNRDHGKIHKPDYISALKKYWTKEKRIAKSKQMKEYRKNHFWSIRRAF